MYIYTLSVPIWKNSLPFLENSVPPPHIEFCTVSTQLYVLRIYFPPGYISLTSTAPLRVRQTDAVRTIHSLVSHQWLWACRWARPRRTITYDSTTTLSIFDNDELQSSNLKRKSNSQFPELEEKLIHYVDLRTKYYKRDKLGISWAKMKNKAAKFAVQLEIPESEFKASNRWINRTLIRHTRIAISLHGEASDMVDDAQREVIMKKWAKMRNSSLLLSGLVVLAPTPMRKKNSWRDSTMVTKQACLPGTFKPNLCWGHVPVLGETKSNTRTKVLCTSYSVLFLQFWF